ncbi:hypothetical protein MLD38_004374 [Melastoma candidum]|uniref:Uncharacterized protein n=1 Tax=Melastoma candidum TaxID=119954 RepID=A0ACB9S572_9MYRT|nr:hypothetical protein MLD38_004374 [Melastoma candidum]
MNSISLLIILGVVLSAAEFFIPPTARAARLLAEVPPPLPGDGRSKIGASPSTPRRDGSWSGGSSPQGTLLVPPPSSVTKIAFASMTATANGTATGNVGAPPP